MRLGLSPGLSAAADRVDVMTENSAQFLANAERFSAIVDAVEDWSAPSACDDWTAAQVLDHVIDSERNHFTTHGVDLGDRPSGTPVEIWTAHLSAMLPHVNDETWMDKQYDGWAGPTTVGDTIADFFGIDLVVHGWDIATSSGDSYAWTEAEQDQAEAFIATMGPMLYSEGVCKPALDPPADASRQVRLLAAVGRAA